MLHLVGYLDWITLSPVGSLVRLADRSSIPPKCRMLAESSDVGAEVAVGSKEVEGRDVELMGDNVGEVEGPMGDMVGLIYELPAAAGASVIFE